MTLYLVRHAPHAVVGSRLCGRAGGYGLDPNGQKRAVRLASALAEARPAAVYASPLERAVQTGQTIARACGVRLRIAESLNEIDFGRWTGMDFADLEADSDWRRWNDARATARPPGGESMAEVQARTWRWIQSLRELHPDERVVAVSHADVIKAVLAQALDLSLDRHDRLQIDPASVSRLTTAEWGSRVLSINEVTNGATDAGRDQDQGPGAGGLVPQHGPRRRNHGAGALPG
jgi:probable phosphoglycerate mutase